MNTAAITDPREARRAMRRGDWTTDTTYQVPGFVQANLVVLARAVAYDFLVFCQRNPQACPVIDITEPGDPEPQWAAPGADLRTDLPRYCVYRDGAKSEERAEINGLWQPDSVGFLIGSSLTFDAPLRRAGVELPATVSSFVSQLPTRPAGPFHGNLVVTVRQLKPAHALIATQLTARFPRNHGAPIHIGDPGQIGVDLSRPFGGPPVALEAGKIPVFWACGVTPQQVALEAKLPLIITHAPGCGFITDIAADQFCLP